METIAAAGAKSYPKVLTIAGSDSGGGAGIQADLKTIGANGCYGMSVITALTAQNTVGVQAIHDVPTEFVQQQLEAVLEDIGADAVKIGMLFSADHIRTVRQQLHRYRVDNTVLDPVMVATSGDSLLKSEAVEAMKKELIPHVDLITPNLPEASVLLQRNISTLNEIEEAAVQLSELGCANVLIKGGHLSDESSEDYLYLGGEKRMVRLPAKRISTANSHGTGCTLSSAIAAFLAKGFSIEEAVRAAKEYIHGAIIAGASYKIGNGHGPVNHFYRFH